MVILLSMPETLVLAHKVSRLTGLELVPVEYRRFPDNESYVRVPVEVSGELVFLFANPALEPDARITRTLIALYTLGDLGASEYWLVSPYFPYARQDSRFRPGEAVTVKYFASMLRHTGVKGVITVDMHLHRIRNPGEELGLRIVNVTVVPELAEYYRSRLPGDAVVVGPDEEASQWASKAGETLGLESTHLEKTRRGDEDVVVTASGARLEGRDVLLVDDIISTGGTIVTASRVLRAMGAGRIYVACSHPLLVGNSLYRILNADVEEVVGSDTVPSPVSRVSAARPISEAIGKVAWGHEG